MKSCTRQGTAPCLCLGSGPLEPSLRTAVLQVMSSHVEQDENLPSDMKVFDEACLFNECFSLSGLA